MLGNAASWQALRGRLSDAVCGASAGVLRIAAVDAILSADRRMSLPAWLLVPFQVHPCVMCLMEQNALRVCPYA